MHHKCFSLSWRITLFVSPLIRSLLLPRTDQNLVLMKPGVRSIKFFTLPSRRSPAAPLARPPRSRPIHLFACKSTILMTNWFFSIFVFAVDDVHKGRRLSRLTYLFEVHTFQIKVRILNRVWTTNSENALAEDVTKTNCVCLCDRQMDAYRIIWIKKKSRFHCRNAVVFRIQLYLAVFRHSLSLS